MSLVLKQTLGILTNSIHFHLSFVHPFAILLFGGELAVQHTYRKVLVDGWIELALAAQTGVMFREVRKQVDKLLERFLKVESKHNSSHESDERYEAVVDGVVSLLTTDTANF